jgi:hypothetical protein
LQGIGDSGGSHSHAAGSADTEPRLFRRNAHNSFAGWSGYPAAGATPFGESSTTPNSVAPPAQSGNG